MPDPGRSRSRSSDADVSGCDQHPAVGSFCVICGDIEMPTRPMPDTRYHFPNVYSVVKAGQREVQRVVTVDQFSWFCERDDCGWSGVGHESEQAALHEAQRHQREAHGV